METPSYGNEPTPVDRSTALREAQQVRSRLASRVRSPWWFHLARGLLVSTMVIGLGGGPGTSPWLLLGVLSLAALARWRVRTVGVSRSNTEQWHYLTLGAPWSTLAFVAAAAGMVAVVALRDLAPWNVAAVAGATGALVALLGPAGDHAARRRLASPDAQR